MNLSLTCSIALVSGLFIVTNAPVVHAAENSQQEVAPLPEQDVESTREFFPDSHEMEEEQPLDVVDEPSPLSLFDQDPYPIPPDTTLTRRDPYTDYRFK